MVLLLAGCGGGSSKSADTAPAAAAAPPPKIAMFYLSPNVVELGTTSQLCYSVESTTKVELDPPVDRVWPALSHCVEVKPTQSTTYTLTASNDAGVKVKATVEAKVVPAQVKQSAVKIVNVSAPTAPIQAGQGFQFCIHAINAKTWNLSAGQWFNPPDASGGCAIDHPRKTTVYVITAIGAGGESDTARVTATVQ